MNLTLKLSIPPLIGLILMMGGLHYYWKPLQLEKERKVFTEQGDAILHSSDSAIIRDLLEGNLASLYANMEYLQREHNEVWFNLELYNDDGKRIYPLLRTEKTTDGGDEHDFIHQQHILNLEGSRIGVIEIDIDWMGEKKRITSDINKMGGMIVAMVLLALLVTLIAQFRLIYFPVKRLAAATKKIADGDLDIPLPITTKDEIGDLTRSFRLMLNELSFKRHALDQHAIVSMTDSNGEIIYVNDHFLEISGYSRENLLGHNHRILKSGVHPVKFYQEMWEAITSGKVWNGEVCNRKKTGDFYWLNATTVPQIDKSGRSKRFIQISTNITQRKKLEVDLTLSRDMAESANQAKSTFLANMSHDIRTPMNGIIGMTQLTLDTDLTPVQQSYLENIKSSANGLLGLLNDILDLSKIEAGQLLMENNDFSLPGMLDNIISVMKFGAEEKEIELTLQYDSLALPAFVKGDELRVRQILVNLIGNAIKFTEKGSVTLKVISENREDNQVELHFMIIDTGIGISAEKQESIFKSFSQADSSTTRKFGGTGLGLTISKQLVEMMDGKVWCESAEGQGSQFHFNVVLQHGDEQKKRQHSDTIKSTTKRLAILLVEDNEINRDLARMVLEKEHHQIIEAENGLKALEILVEKDVDLILMDVQMPAMDGLTATTIIRASENNNDLSSFNLSPSLSQKLVEQRKGKHIPIVAMTANAMTGDREKCLATGMDNYLTKPFEPSQIRKILSDMEKNISLSKDITSTTEKDLRKVVQDYVKTVYSFDDAMTEQFLVSCRKSLSENFEKAHAYATDGDLEALNRVMHSLKGSLLNIGLTDTAARAQELENTSNQGEDIPYEEQLLDIQDHLATLLTDDDIASRR